MATSLKVRVERKGNYLNGDVLCNLHDGMCVFFFLTLNLYFICKYHDYNKYRYIAIGSSQLLNCLQYDLESNEKKYLALYMMPVN